MSRARTRPRPLPTDRVALTPHGIALLELAELDHLARTRARLERALRLASASRAPTTTRQRST